MSETGTSNTGGALDQDDMSELLDGDVLGEEVGDADRPGATSFPPDRALGAEDPSLYDADDLETRTELRRDVDAADRDERIVLVDPAPEGALDHEAELVADTAEAADAERAAEEAAVHLIDRDPVD